MESSPRRPSSTILILSSAEKCRRVLRRMSFTTCPAGFLDLEDLGFIFVPLSLRRSPNPPQITTSNQSLKCCRGSPNHRHGCNHYRHPQRLLPHHPRQKR